jgi:hypothetical protein
MRQDSGSLVKRSEAELGLDLGFDCKKGCAARRCFGRVSAETEAGWSVQSRNRLGVCLADDERQATALARNALATIRTTGSEGGEDSKAVGFHTFRHTYTTLLTQNTRK